MAFQLRLARRTQRPSLDLIQCWLRDRVTLESFLYALILVAAVLTRFWDLGSRALHHDETLHTYYSWLFATGQGYRHHPVMHGPFLFHANALVYLLFGATDYVSRVVPAAAGVALVMLPWLLRGASLLGRWGALIAPTLLLLSPSLLYFSRFIRHDIYALLGTMVLFIALVRYVERPERRWAILGGIAIGFMLTNHEVSFIVLFAFVTFVGLAVSLQVAPKLLLIGGVALVVFSAVVKGLQLVVIPGLPGIPWQNPTNSGVLRFFVALVLHPSVVSAVVIGLVAVAATYRELSRRRDYELGWIESLLGPAPTGSTAAALRELIQERSGLLIGAGLGGLVFVVLYTSLFTNIVGLISGTIGALGYWLGQQGVQRGDQPWFYYLVLGPQYEFVTVLLLPAGVIWVAWRGARVRRAGVGLDRRFFLRTVLIYWALLMLTVLSWAGEKMPWLVIHMVLPLTLLAASVLGEVAESIDKRWLAWSGRVRRESLLLGLGVMGLAATEFLVLSWATAGPVVEVGGHLQRTVRPEVLARWWIVYVPLLALAGILVVGAARLGRRQALRVLAVAGALALILAQVHVSWRMTHRDGDVPTDMLVYVQSSPYIPQVAHELNDLSQELTGGMGLAVWYDDHTQWPFNWYLRNFPNRHLFGMDLPDSPVAPVILMANDNLTPENRKRLNGYTFQEYPLRWWFPEVETYRRFAIAPELKNQGWRNLQTSQPPPYGLLDVARSVWSSIWAMREPQQQGNIFRLVAFRELPAPVGSYNFRVYIRDDLVPYVDGLHD
jgi:uncharacterized protein (TIGR03663 family)